MMFYSALYLRGSQGDGLQEMLITSWWENPLDHECEILDKYIAIV